jgi:hypothetical protein
MGNGVALSLNTKPWLKIRRSLRVVSGGDFELYWLDVLCIVVGMDEGNWFC